MFFRLIFTTEIWAIGTIYFHLSHNWSSPFLFIFNSKIWLFPIITKCLGILRFYIPRYPLRFKYINEFDCDGVFALMHIKYPLMRVSSYRISKLFSTTVGTWQMVMIEHSKHASFPISYLDFPAPVLYPPTKVGGWQTYRVVCFVVPPKTGFVECIR